MGNLIWVMNAVKEGRYFPSKYRRFMVTDPKERMILALPYVDRVVHQWFVEEFIKPYYVPKMIHDSYACIVGRGTHMAMARVREFQRKAAREWGEKYYIVKMDISKFFNSIDKEILMEILFKGVRDEDLRELIRVMVYDGDEHVGIPIGNYISQYFANIYLNEMDQFVKHELRVKYYIRYMDDFVVMVRDREEARRVFEAIREFVERRLRLEFNRKSGYFPAVRGLDFVGYRVFLDYTLLRKRSKVKLRRVVRDFDRGRDDFERFYGRVNAWLGHAGHADGWRYTHKVLGERAGYFDVVSAKKGAAAKVR
jgi:retron-type reverse transcriptase